MEGFLGVSWRENAYTLVSMLEMLKRYSYSFVSIMDFFERTNSLMDSLMQSESEGNPLTDERWETVKDNLCERLENVLIPCKEIELTIASRRIGEVIDSIRRGISYSEILSELREVRRLIRDELMDKMFFYIPTNYVEYYQAPSNEWDETIKRFPHVISDIEEASKCIALRRTTACVFHLMRILELGVQELALKIDSTINTSLPWGDIQKKLDKALESPNYLGSRKAEFSELSAYLTHVRRAWRNLTMHPLASYTEEDAQEILRNTRIFMNHLAVTL